MSDTATCTTMTRRIPILAYHAIGDGTAPTSTPASRFRDHMQSLVEDGWRALTLSELLEGYARGAWPARSVVLTFDDGMTSVAEHAFPILERLGLPAILFAVSGRLGGRSDWEGWSSAVPAERLLDAQALKDAADSGVEIGAHSVSHARLSRLPAGAAEREIVGSQQALEDMIGKPIRCFAYPFGDAPPSAVTVVKRRFAAGFGIGVSHASPGDALAILPRIDAHYLRGTARLGSLDRASTRAWLAMRRALRHVRRVSVYGRRRRRA